MAGLGVSELGPELVLMGNWQTPGFGVNVCSPCQAELNSYNNYKASGSKALAAWGQAD